MRTSFMIRRWWIAVLLLASLRLAHINLLWSDEDYHLAAAIQILHGRVPYRDFWYDKPPLAALFYLLIGGHAGWLLRFLDVLFVVACGALAYRLARSWWGENEGRTAALLLAFFTAFYLTSATIPLAVDGLLLLPHLAAVYFASGKRPFASGCCCAIGLLTNVKAVFVAATCALWLLGDLPLFAAGCALPLALAAILGTAFGMFHGFYQQVWQWGIVYAASQNSILLGVRRCADWLGFHAALLAGAIVARSEWRYRAVCWLLLSSLPLLMGNHFAPRYFFQVLPVMVIMASRGIVLAWQRWGLTAVVALAVMLVVPCVRFGPRYAELILDNVAQRQTRWLDAALDQDSQQVANVINAHKQNGDTLFVWGYRPDIYVYTRLIPAGKFLDSQPLDGVPADRHLQSSESIPVVTAQENRSELVSSQPAFIVDGLGPLNPTLSPQNYPETALWLRSYRLVATTKLSRIYRRANATYGTTERHP